jgi:hypothetical protein
MLADATLEALAARLQALEARASAQDQREAAAARLRQLHLLGRDELAKLCDERLALADPDLGAAYQGSAQALLQFDQRARTVHLHELPPTECQRHLSSLPGYSRRIGSERELRPELGEDVS